MQKKNEIEGVRGLAFERTAQTSRYTLDVQTNVHPLDLILLNAKCSHWC